jgi:hypothetical protein
MHGISSPASARSLVVEAILSKIEPNLETDDSSEFEAT